MNRDALPGLVWPPLASAREAELPALMHQLAALEHAPWLTMAAGQQAQLRALTRHFIAHSEAFRQRLRAAGLPLQALDLETLKRLPPLRRRDLQAAGDAMFCAPPPGHEPVGRRETSGSSGEPVVVIRTAVTHLFWLAHNLRDHVWWQRDFSGTLAVIRAHLPRHYIDQEGWGPPASLVTRTGPAHACSIAVDTERQARWLAAINPHYLLTYPFNLADVIRQLDALGLALPRLRQVRTLGESVSDELRAAVKARLGVGMTDIYSCNEVGVIGVQCPVSGLYHLQADNLIVEVLDEAGRPCKPGEIGEVLITDLHNFATPLLRYALNDYAEAGPACACGRTLPTLRRIVGRQRNLVRYPDGTRRWPLTGFARCREVAPVMQYQLAQTRPEHIEVRLTVERPLSAAEEAALARILRESLGHPFALGFVYFPDGIPRGAGGKFEEFVSCL